MIVYKSADVAPLGGSRIFFNTLDMNECDTAAKLAEVVGSEAVRRSP
jgi:hypothetical protein